MQHTPALWLFLHFCFIVHCALHQQRYVGSAVSNGLAVCCECPHTDQVAACKLSHPACMIEQPFVATNRICWLTC